MKKSNNFAQQFENWANTVSEGTWATPDTEEQVSELTELLMEPLPVGVDAINAINALYNLIGDDVLFDKLGDLADEDSEADARDVVMDWVQENNPTIYQRIMSVIGDEDTADQTVDEGYDDGESDSSDAVQSAIIRRIMNQHLDLLSQYGPEAITNATKDVADWVGNVEEIGSSDVSAWVKEVINNLGGTDEGQINELEGDALAAYDKYKNNNQDEIEFERDRDEPDQDDGSDMQFDQDRDEDLPQWAEWPTKNSEMDESKMSDMDIDVSDLTDQEFLEKYNHTKQQAMDGDWENHYEPETMPEPTDESIGDDYVNKDEKMKRMGAKDLSTLDKVKIMPSQMKAMAKGDDEGDLTAYNKQFNEEIAQMRKIAGIK